MFIYQVLVEGVEIILVRLNKKIFNLEKIGIQKIIGRVL